MRLPMLLEILLVSVVSLLVNAPLGMWRERTKKFSWQWVVAVHASIPLIIALRIWLRLPLIAIPSNMTAAVLGQFLGGRSQKRPQGIAHPLT